MTGLVLVSHSRPLAEAVRELALQMTRDEDAPQVLVAAGTADGGLGTDAAAVAEAIEQAGRDGDDVVVFVDLGSAVMSAQMALDFVNPQLAARTLLTDAPLVEGAVPAVVAAALGRTGAQVAAEAQHGLDAKRDQLRPEGHDGTHSQDASSAPADHQRPDASASPAPGGGRRPEATATAKITDPQGLHARPAAALARTLTGLDAQATVARPGADPVPADSPSLLATLAAPTGTTLTFAAWGPDADRAVQALADAVRGDDDAPSAPAAHTAATAVSSTPLQPNLPRLICRPRVDESSYRPSGDPVRERERLDVAIKQAARTVSDARDRACTQPDVDTAKIKAILDMIEALVRDSALAKGAVAKIKSGQDAVTAVHTHVSDIADRLVRAAKSDYLRQRSQDLMLAAHLVEGALVGEPTAAVVDCAQVKEPFVLRVRQLDAVSAALTLPSGIRGIEVRQGINGHGVMIARALGIPVSLLGHQDEDEDAPTERTANAEAK